MKKTLILIALLAGAIAYGQLDRPNYSRPQVIAKPSTPAAATDACVVGAIWYDASYVYVCVTSGGIKRAAIATW